MSSTAGTMERRPVIQVIARAAEMMRHLASEPDGMAIAEMCRRIDLPRSTVYRIASALGEEGFVRTTPTGRLQIGPAILGFSAAQQHLSWHDVRPHLARLSEAVDETVYLARLDGADVVFIEECVCPADVRVVSRVGARFPAYCTAQGKVLLALLSREALCDLLPRRLQPRTPHTITERVALLTELDIVRGTGIAIDREEHTLGIAGAAAAVTDASGQAAAVTVMAPVARYERRRDTILESLLVARGELQRELDDTRLAQSA